MEPSEKKVTVIDSDQDNQINLSPDKLNVLSLGPNFSTVPRINDELLNDIKIGIAQFAYRKRWIDVFEQKSEDEEDITPLSVMDKIRGSTGPFQASRCIAPPVDYTLESEPALKMLNNYIINIVSSTKVESNLSKSEAIGIKSLKKRDNISITIWNSQVIVAILSPNDCLIMLSRINLKFHNYVNYYIFYNGLWQVL